MASCQWHPTPVLLPGKSHGRRSLEGCSPWGHWGSDTTERLHFHFSLSCIGEGNGNPLQCSCLENPRDGGAWWAAVYGVAQSQTRLKWLSSSSIEHKFAFWKQTPKILFHSIGNNSIALKSEIETLTLLNICCKAASQNDKSWYFPGECECVSQDTRSHVQNMSLSSKARTNKILLCVSQLKFSLTTGKWMTATNFCILI